MAHLSMFLARMLKNGQLFLKIGKYIYQKVQSVKYFQSIFALVNRIKNITSLCDEKNHNTLTTTYQ